MIVFTRRAPKELFTRNSTLFFPDLFLLAKAAFPAPRQNPARRRPINKQQSDG
jgi:hypothetical protein